MLLAAHPEEQRLLQAEIDAVLQQGQRALAYEDLDQLVLCQGAMNEALRLFPPVVRRTIFSVYCSVFLLCFMSG